MTQGLIELVFSKTAINDLIGTDPMRFYSKILPQGISTLPAMTYRIVVENDNPDLHNPSKYDFVSVDFQCYGRKPADAENLWKTTRKELEGVYGTFGGLQIEDVVYMPSGAEDFLEDLEYHTKQLELRIDYIRQP